MNGFKLQAESYRIFLKKHPDCPNKESMERVIKANEVMAQCTEADICALYDTGAFNDITAAYLKKAMEQAGISHTQISAAMDELRWLHDTMNATTITSSNKVNS